MAGNVAPRPCPKCSGPMWDNIDSKKNPKAPDYACKNKQGCGGGVWLSDTEKNALRGSSAAPGVPSIAGGTKSPVVLDGLYFHSMKAARVILEKLAADGLIAEGYTLAQQISVANQIFDKRVGAQPGLLKAEKLLLEQKAAAAPPPPPPPPLPPPPPPPQQVAPEIDDGLPF